MSRSGRWSITSAIVRNLLLPTILLLAPISPVAWLPVAIFVFGIGDVPAIFLVFITVFFAIVLSTVSQFESVPTNYLHVARIMGASEAQMFWRVILPAILPSLFMTLRLNLFAAWMVVLIAEAVGVGTGLGQITSMARATFNAKLVFFTMALIGVLGFAFDWACATSRAHAVVGGTEPGRQEMTEPAIAIRNVAKTWTPEGGPPSMRSATSTSTWCPASSWSCSARRAAARPRCST